MCSRFGHKLLKAPRVIWMQLCMYRKWLIFKIAKNWVILNRISPRLRPWLWKRTGVNIHGSVCIGYDVYYDVTNASLINIDDGAWITSRCLLLCHRRDMREYFVGDDVNSLPYIKAPIHICKGVHLGMGSIVLPGVTIGEGAIIGAGSVITKDIPAWTVACGVPCRVIKNVASRDAQNTEEN